MSEEDGIRRTLAQYCQYCDDGRFDEFGDLFSAKAVFHVMDKSHEGRGRIKTFMAEAMPRERRGKHHCANSVIELSEDGESALAFTDYIFVGRTENGFGITQVGRYHDRLVKEKDRWRFAERRIVFLGGEAPEA